MRVFRILLAILAIAVALTASTVVAQGGRPLEATLTGAAEVPGPGDSDGSGAAKVTINIGRGEICFDIQVSNITLPATLAHIHVGSADVAGPIVVTLVPPDQSGNSSGCVTDVDKDLAKAILKDPGAYYVNVHTSDFPAGAIRGQLSK